MARGASTGRRRGPPPHPPPPDPPFAQLPAGEAAAPVLHGTAGPEPHPGHARRAARAGEAGAGGDERTPRRRGSVRRRAERSWGPAIPAAVAPAASLSLCARMEEVSPARRSTGGANPLGSSGERPARVLHLRGLEPGQRVRPL